MQNFVTRQFFITLVCLTIGACDAPPPEGTAASDDAVAFGDLSIPIEFENLQVLPENISRRALMRNMKEMSRSLGVRCKHCHNMKTEDYSADDIEAKLVARDMMRMLENLNKEIFIWKGAPQATCYMCHRDELEPTLTRPASLKSSAGISVIVPESEVDVP